MTNKQQHPSIERMRRLRGKPGFVLQQARESSKDFTASYGDPVREIAALKQAGMVPNLDLLRQADFKTTTSGILNRLFGRGVWAQLNVHAPTWDSLPKSQRGVGNVLGWRAKTAFASSGKGGQAEGTIPTAIVGSYTEITPTPKEHSTQMRVSGLHQDMYEMEDAYGSLQEAQVEVAIEHGKEIERALTEDIDTAAGNNMESVDRISASSANQAAIGWTAGDEDLFGVDRSANTWFNGTQDAAATARALTTKLLDGIFRQVVAKGGQPTYWLTGFDTWEAISDLMEARGRFDMQSVMSRRTQEDAEGAEGLEVATFTGSYQGRTIVCSDVIEADANELSRIYLHDVTNPEGMNKPRLGIDIIRPTQVYLAGERSMGAPQAIDFAGDSVLVITRGELGCRFAGVQGQVRDTTSP